jgi:hypothetical protein
VRPLPADESRRGAAWSEIGFREGHCREVYAAIFIDAVTVKVRDGQVASRPNLRGHRRDSGREKDISGLRVGTGGEGARF